MEVKSNKHHFSIPNASIGIIFKTTEQG
ncbi:hypothetical protein CCACVL1_28438 [Corchorus capsularis]|uniref:Uncharacterized protein n=1 Tax=Corchorus capsularis TaxID=210143 RepID=A0A1R3G6F8_COCAP|nr:hypothetical protein CCACVL1_28438 [Corchorus capsularis]